MLIRRIVGIVVVKSLQRIGKPLPSLTFLLPACHVRNIQHHPLNSSNPFSHAQTGCFPTAARQTTNIFHSNSFGISCDHCDVPSVSRQVDRGSCGNYRFPFGNFIKSLHQCQIVSSVPILSSLHSTASLSNSCLHPGIPLSSSSSSSIENLQGPSLDMDPQKRSELLKQMRFQFLLEKQ